MRQLLLVALTVLASAHAAAQSSEGVLPAPAPFDFNLIPDQPAFISCDGPSNAQFGADILYSCTGNLLIRDGYLTASNNLTLEASGTLSLSTVALQALNIVVLASSLNLNDRVIMQTSNLSAATPVPEPASWALMGTGLLATCCARRRQRT